MCRDLMVSLEAPPRESRLNVALQHDLPLDSWAPPQRNAAPGAQTQPASSASCLVNPRWAAPHQHLG